MKMYVICLLILISILGVMVYQAFQEPSGNYPGDEGGSAGEIILLHRSEQ